MKKFNLTFEFEGKFHDIELTAERLGLMYAYSSISSNIETGDEFDALSELFRERNKITTKKMDKLLDETDIRWEHNGKKYRIFLIFFDDSLEIYTDDDKEALVGTTEYIITEKDD